MQLPFFPDAGVTLCMKFILGSGGQLRNRLKIFPEYYQYTFSCSPILVISFTGDDEVVGACGISNISNYAQVYVQEEYRGRGLGTRVVVKACGEARKRGLNFVTAAIDLWNEPSLSVFSKAGFREIVRFKTYGYVIMMLPFNFKGKLLYASLNTLCSFLPETFLHYLIICLMSVVGQTRQRLIANWVGV